MNLAYLKRHLNCHDEAGEAASQNGVGVTARCPDPQSLLSIEPWPSLAMGVAESLRSPVKEDMPVRAGHLSLLRDTLLLVLFLVLVLIGFSVFDRHGTIDPDLAAAPMATPALQVMNRAAPAAR
jgi:hypothetical protein